MTYQPLAETYDTGTAYFESLGLIGGSTGMVPLVVGSSTFPALDDYDGTALTITDSVAKSATAGASSWAGWNLSSAITKCLIVAYEAPGTSQYTGVGVGSGTLPTTSLQNDYATMHYPPGSLLNIGKHVTNGGTTWTTIGSEATIFQDDVVTAAVWGIAFYVDADNDIQRTFLKSGTAQWLQVLETADDSSASGLTSFQSVFLRHEGSDCRFITPIMCWGA